MIAGMEDDKVLAGLLQKETAGSSPGFVSAGQAEAKPADACI